MSKISVVIPTFNESLRIEETVKSVLNYFTAKEDVFEIIVSDDGSTDNTLEKIQPLIEINPKLKILKNIHLGKAAAVKMGIEASGGDLILMMDADGAVPIEEIEELQREMEETSADIAIGSREGRGARRINEPFYRHLLGRVFNLCVKVLTGLTFEDTQCGFKLFKAPVAKELSQRSIIMNRQNDRLKDPLVTAFDVELLVLAKKYGFGVVEIPIAWRHVPTQNVNPLKDSLRMLLDVLSIRLNLALGKYI